MGHFGSRYVHDVTQERGRELSAAVRGLTADLLSQDTDDVVDELVEAHRLSVPTLDADRVEVVEQGEPRDSPGTIRVVFAVPFEGQPGLFDVRPSAHQLVPFSGIVHERELRLTVHQSKATPETIQAALDRQLSQYQQELSQLRHDVRGFNETLRDRARELVEQRRAELASARDVLASLPFPVRKREDAVIPVPIARRVEVVRPPAAASSYEAEPEVALRDYDAILASTRSMGLVMERAPGTFSGLHEEGIRDFFLALLNFGYHGEAMGEVFNGSGKTDILIRVGERNVFIAECKVWAGLASFKKEALGQLLRYLGWRDTKCAVLLFVHQRDVSRVMAEADAAIREHDCFVRPAPGAVGELERRYVLHWPGDTSRELTLTLQVFAVPTTEPKRQRRRAAKAGV